MRSPQEISNRLLFLCKEVGVALEKISEEDFSVKPAPGKWSKKEILGHLIDSATNNHQRFIRIQFEENPVIGYDQNKWNEYSRYQQMPKAALIRFWQQYNQHLASLILFVKEEDWNRTGKYTAESDPKTLHWLADDYVVHMEHHLKAMGLVYS